MNLTSKQIKTINKLEHHLFALFKDEASGHDFGHIKRVVGLTTRLLHEPADAFIALVVAYLHDVFDDKLTITSLSFDVLMTQWGIDLEDSHEQIERDIKTIGYKGGYQTPSRSLEATIVSDADLLDSMGAIGIARAFYYAGFKGLPFHDDTLMGVVATNYDDYRNLKRNAIAHFDEKLLKLKDAVVTPKAKKMADQRHQILKKFYDDFYQELHEGSIIQYFEHDK